MTTSAVFITSPGRGERIMAELSVGLAGVSRGVLRAWGRRAARRFLPLTQRRVVGLVFLASRVARVLCVEGGAAAKAAFAGQLKPHLRDRAGAVAADGMQLARSAGALALRVARDPLAAASEVLGAGVGFLLGSGGLDANGGLPDLDLKVSIGAHRSIFTHSIIGGVIAEAIVLALLDLVLVVHGHLPGSHDPLWTALVDKARRFGLAATSGLGAGMAYHLGIDGSVQGMTPYKDLPFPLPMEGHEALLGANALAESADLMHPNKGRLS